MYRFLVRPGWIAAHLVVAAAVTLFAVAGLWQLRRLDERRTRNALMASRAAMPPVPLDEALRAGTGAEYRRVVVEGRFDAEHEVLLRGRALDGRPGFHVLTPLVTGDGTVIVDRGWVPFQHDRPPVAAALPPPGDVEVSGALMPSQDRARIGPQDPPGRLVQIGIVEVPRLAQQLPYPVAPLWLKLDGQAPAQSGTLPVARPPDEPTEGRHLAYAVQWFAFIPVALVTYALWARSYARRRTPAAIPPEAGPDPPETGAERRFRGKKASPPSP